MLIVQLNRNPNQEMMVSRINERNERKVGLQVRLGVGDLHLGEDLRHDKVAFVKERQKLVILGLRVHLGEAPYVGEAPFAYVESFEIVQKWHFCLFSIESFQPHQNKPQNPTQNNQKHIYGRVRVS